MSIDHSAIIHESAKIHKGAIISPYAVIGANVEIGSGTVIDSHAVIEGPTKIGKNNNVETNVTNELVEMTKIMDWKEKELAVKMNYKQSK